MDGRDRPSGADDPVQPRERTMGLQHPAVRRARAAHAALDRHDARREPDRHAPGRQPRRRRPPRPGLGPDGVALRAGPLQDRPAHGPQLHPGPGGHRHRLPHHFPARRRAHGQSRLRRGRSRHAAGQPHALRPLLSREAAVLHRRRELLRLRSRHPGRLHSFLLAPRGPLRRPDHSDHGGAQGGRARRPVGRRRARRPDARRLRRAGDEPGRGPRDLRRQPEPAGRARSAPTAIPTGAPATRSPAWTRCGKPRASRATRISAFGLWGARSFGDVGAGDRGGWGVKVQYPNDLWNLQAPSRSSATPSIRPSGSFRGREPASTAPTPRTSRGLREASSPACGSSSSSSTRSSSRTSTGRPNLARLHGADQLPDAGRATTSRSTTRPSSSG